MIKKKKNQSRKKTLREKKRMSIDTVARQTDQVKSVNLNEARFYPKELH